MLIGAWFAGLLATWLPGLVCALESVPQTVRIDGETYPVRVPVGYRLELLTRNLDGPRLFNFAANGDLTAGVAEVCVGGTAGRHPGQRRGVVDDQPHRVAARGQAARQAPADAGVAVVVDHPAENVPGTRHGHFVAPWSSRRE